MDIITIPILRNKELQDLTREVKEACYNIPELAENIKKLEQLETEFATAMNKEKATTVDKRSLDKVRDQCYTGMLTAIKSERVFPYNEEQKAAIEDVWRIISKHGTSIIRLRYHEQTAAMDNLIADIKGLDSLAKAGESITKWIPVVEDSNEAFKSISSDFIDETTDIKAQNSATTLVPLLRNAVEDLVLDLYSHSRISKSPELSKTFLKIETIISSYN